MDLDKARGAMLRRWRRRGIALRLHRLAWELSHELYPPPVDAGALSRQDVLKLRSLVRKVWALADEMAPAPAWMFAPPEVVPAGEVIGVRWLPRPFIRVGG